MKPDRLCLYIIIKLSLFYYILQKSIYRFIKNKNKISRKFCDLRKITKYL